MSVIENFKDRDTKLREVIFQAIGEASMCWTPRPSNQVFDSSRAEIVAASVYNYLIEREKRLLAVVDAARELMLAVDDERNMRNLEPYSLNEELRKAFEQLEK